MYKRYIWYDGSFYKIFNFWHDSISDGKTKIWGEKKEDFVKEVIGCKQSTTIKNANLINYQEVYVR